MSKQPRKYEEKKPFYLGSPSIPNMKKATLPEVKPVIAKKKKSMIPPSKPGQINMAADVKALYPEGCKYDPDVKDPLEKFASQDLSYVAAKKADRSGPLEKFASQDLSNVAAKKADRSGPLEKFASQDLSNVAAKKADLSGPLEKFASQDLSNVAKKKARRSVVSYKSNYFTETDQESIEEALRLVDELARIEITEKEEEKAAAAKKEMLEKEKANKKGKVVGGILTWNDYFMSLSLLSAGRSKDPNTKVGACIVNEENKIIGMGYNGMPNGIADEELPWTKKDLDILNTKYPYVCHAEMNAIMNKNTANLKGCIMYTTRYPCNECAKLIVQSGIVKVVYGTDISVNTAANIVASFAALRIFELSGVHTVEYKADLASIHVDFESLTMTLE